MGGRDGPCWLVHSGVTRNHSNQHVMEQYIRRLWCSSVTEIHDHAWGLSVWESSWFKRWNYTVKKKATGVAGISFLFACFTWTEYVARTHRRRVSSASVAHLCSSCFMVAVIWLVFSSRRLIMLFFFCISSSDDWQARRDRGSGEEHNGRMFVQGSPCVSILVLSMLGCLLGNILISLGIINSVRL